MQFQKGSPVGHQLTWSHYRELLPIKDENKRNYYLNLCMNKDLSKRELINEIKKESYERLLNKPEKIDLILPTKQQTILSDMKNPILLDLQTKEEPKNEKDLELLILAQLKGFFEQLGERFTFVDNQYKFSIENRNYYIDMLLFNYVFNRFIVVELKYRELKKEDKAQIEFYMDFIDKTLRKEFHNKTIDIIILKEERDYSSYI